MPSGIASLTEFASQVREESDKGRDGAHVLCMTTWGMLRRNSLLSDIEGSAVGCLCSHACVLGNDRFNCHEQVVFWNSCGCLPWLLSFWLHRIAMKRETFLLFGILWFSLPKMIEEKDGQRYGYSKSQGYILGAKGSYFNPNQRLQSEKNSDVTAFFVVFVFWPNGQRQ